MEKLPGDSWYIYMDDIDPNIKMNQSLFDRIWDIRPKEKGKIKIYGKEIETARWQQTYG